MQTGVKKIIVVFGATGTQGSGIINVVLALPALAAKYSLRAVTRDPTSDKGRKLAERGVEVVKADVGDLPSVKEATRGAYGVFGMTDYWAVHSKEIEVEHGINIFKACQQQGVKHLVFSSLPHGSKSTNGALKLLGHYDSKAEVEEYIEANKADMVASYVIPGMFMSFIPNLLRKENGSPLLKLPFPSESSPWAFSDPPRDLGKFVLGLFERGEAANGVKVHAVSSWSSPRQVVDALSRECGRTVGLRIVSPETFAADFPKTIAGELTETLQIIGEYGFVGKGEHKKQAEHNTWLVSGSDEPIAVEEWIRQNGPWTFETMSFLDVLAEQKRKLDQERGGSA